MLIVVLVSIEILATCLDVLCGPYGTIHWEERINAVSGIHILTGHHQEIWNLQYMPNCGGCTADALLAAGIFSVLGPTVHAYKLIPCSFHIALILAGLGLAWSMAGRRAAVVFAVLMMGQPALFRSLSTIGWGNHAESRFFPFFAALLLCVHASSRLPWLRAGLAGLVTGLGLWYCNITIHAFPALLVMAFWRPGGWRGGLPFLLGTFIGFTPWISYAHHDPTSNLLLAGPDNLAWFGGLGELPHWLAGRNLLRTLWPEQTGEVPALGPPGTYWFGLWGVALLGVAMAARTGCLRLWKNAGSTNMPPNDGPWRAAAFVFGPLALAGLVAAYVFRHELWTSSLGARDFFNLRYLSPILPVLAICAAASQLTATPRFLRDTSLILLLGIGVGGFWLRARDWGSPRTHQLGLTILEDNASDGITLYRHGIPDLVVHLESATEEPGMGRNQHFFVLGHDIHGDQKKWASHRAEYILNLARTEDESRSVLEGFSHGLARELDRDSGHCEPLEVERVLVEACVKLRCRKAPGSRRALAVALLNAARTTCDVREWGPSLPEGTASMADGFCEFRGQDAVRDMVESGGMRVPSSEQLDALELLERGCHDEPSFSYGMGWGWAHWVGCTPESRSILTEWAGSATNTEVKAGLEDGCRVYRPNSR